MNVVFTIAAIMMIIIGFAMAYFSEKVTEQLRGISVILFIGIALILSEIIKLKP